MGWILIGESKHNNTRMMSKYAPDLAKHRFYVWLNNYHWLPIVVLAALLWVLGELPMVLWGVCLRVVIGLHATWMVNSVTHMWGARRFATHDDSRNNWWVALITFGEGWHNNHHAHPTSARHGLAWYEFDPSWLLIRTLERLGLAKSVYAVTVDGASATRRAA
jgi:stearoyl-CoA desaturase (delta-9 desaturase)